MICECKQRAKLPITDRIHVSIWQTTYQNESPGSGKAIEICTFISYGMWGGSHHTDACQIMSKKITLFFQLYHFPCFSISRMHSYILLSKMLTLFFKLNHGAF